MIHINVYRSVAHDPSTLYVFKFWGGAIQFWMDHLCNCDAEYTLVLFGLIRIDLGIDFTLSDEEIKRRLMTGDCSECEHAKKYGLPEEA